MSGFKRGQSRVFWNRMATQDLGNSPFAHPESPIASPRTQGTPKTPKTPLSNLESTYAEVSENSSCDVTTDASNVTVIRVERCISSGSEASPKFEGEDNFAETEKSEENARFEERSHSSASQGHRSLDSGFSDSDSSADEGTPTGRRRKRRIRNRERCHRHLRNHRLSSLWRENEVPPNPAHTSTPKKFVSGFNVQESRSRIESSCQLTKLKRKEDVEASKYPSMDSSTLGDFLFVTEPREDSVPSTSSSCSKSLLNYVDSSKSIEALNFNQFAPIKAWLNNLALETAAECGATLQSKALPRKRLQDSDSEEAQSRDLRMLTASATTAATKLLMRADRFDQHYQNVLEKVSHLASGRSEIEQLRSIEEDAFSVLSDLGAPPPRRIHQGSLRSIIAQLQNLKHVVDDALNTRLDFYVERVVRGLEEAPTEGGSAARGALAALTALGMSGPRAGSSIARCSGVRSLLTSLISASRLSSDLRSASLRALASVCCCPEAIEKFSQEDGPEILVDLLATESRPETEKMEATALVVQITAPWINSLGLPCLEPFANTVVDALAKLAEKTTCGQTLLLAAAALNHLSKSRKCVRAILRRDAIRKLLQCVKKSPGGNIWLMEQVASLIGEVARIPEARSYLADVRASVALVCFLRMRPPGLKDAYQRLEVTAAAALTRLCVDPEIARQVVAVGGTDCLPSYKIDEHSSEDEDQEACLLRYTRSLRLACRKAAQQIDVAKAHDYTLS